MVNKATLQTLAELGWPILVRAPFDLCWLDCNRKGWLKTDDAGELCICLCPEHAMVLESGAYNGDYNGALLPAGSMANEWPWMKADDVAALR